MSRIQDDDFFLYRFYYISFIGYMIKGKTCLDYTTLFSSNDNKTNDNITNKNVEDKCGIGKRKP